MFLICIFLCFLPLKTPDFNLVQHTSIIFARCFIYCRTISFNHIHGIVGFGLLLLIKILKQKGARFLSFLIVLSSIPTMSQNSNRNISPCITPGHLLWIMPAYIFCTWILSYNTHAQAQREYELRRIYAHATRSCSLQNKTWCTSEVLWREKLNYTHMPIKISNLQYARFF